MHFNALKNLTLRSQVDLIWTSAILPFCNPYYLAKLPKNLNLDLC